MIVHLRVRDHVGFFLFQRAAVRQWRRQRMNAMDNSSSSQAEQAQDRLTDDGNPLGKPVSTLAQQNAGAAGVFEQERTGLVPQIGKRSAQRGDIGGDKDEADTCQSTRKATRSWDRGLQAGKN